MSHCSRTRYRKPREAHNERERTESAAGPDPDLNGIDFSSSNLKTHLSSSHRAVPPQPSNTPEWDNLHQTEELSHSELRNTCHKCRRLFFFFFFPSDWRHLPFAFERLSKMCELTARCCSLPSEARSSFQSPERLLSKPSPLLDPPSLLCAVNFQRSIWLLNASGLKDESQQPDLSACSSYLYWGWSLSLSEEA